MIPRSISRGVLVVAYAVLPAACGASPPDEATARAAFEQRRVALDSFENGVTTVLALTTKIEAHEVAAIVGSAGAFGFAGNDLVPSVAACPPTAQPGVVAPEQGVAIDRYRLGWGMYQQGDGYLPGIAVRWALGDEGSPLADAVTLCFLLDAKR